MANSKENMQLTQDVLPRIEQHMRRAGVPKEFVPDMDGYEKYRDLTKALFLPLKPKHVLNSERLPVDRAAASALKKMQEEYGTGPDSFPALIFLSLGTKEFKVELGMVQPERFNDQPYELLEQAKWASATLNDENSANYRRSIEFVYTVMTGARPKESLAPQPLKDLPGESSFV